MPWQNGRNAPADEAFAIRLSKLVHELRKCSPKGGKPSDLPSPKAYPCYYAAFLRWHMARRYQTELRWTNNSWQRTRVIWTNNWSCGVFSIRFLLKAGRIPGHIVEPLTARDPPTK